MMVMVQNSTMTRSETRHSYSKGITRLGNYNVRTAKQSRLVSPRSLPQKTRLAEHPIQTASGPRVCQHLSPPSSSHLRIRSPTQLPARGHPVQCPAPAKHGFPRESRYLAILVMEKSYIHVVLGPRHSCHFKRSPWAGVTSTGPHHLVPFDSLARLAGHPIGQPTKHTAKIGQVQPRQPTTPPRGQTRRPEGFQTPSSFLFAPYQTPPRLFTCPHDKRLVPCGIFVIHPLTVALTHA